MQMGRKHRTFTDKFKAKVAIDMESEEHEHKNWISQYPEIAEELHKKLNTWCGELQNKVLPDKPLNRQETAWFAHYLAPCGK